MPVEFRIAVIHADTLASIGLKQMLQEVMPMVVVDIFRSVGEIPEGAADGYIHYFASASAVADNVRFFMEHRRKTRILNASPETLSSPFAGFNYICTSVPEKELVKSLLALEQAAHAGGRNLPPAAIMPNERQLSVREVEVMSLVVKGFINKEIADRLNISLATVVTHRRNIMEKLGIRSVSALTVYAVMHGYVDINAI